MAVTATQFKTRFPEFGSTPPVEVDLYLADALLQVDSGSWGSKADMGQSYLAAHMLATFGSGASSDEGTGVLTGKKVGQVSANYAVSKNFGESAYGSTKYGRHFLTLVQQIFSPRVL